MTPAASAGDAVAVPLGGVVPSIHVVRTNTEIEETYLRAVMDRYRLRTKTDAVILADTSAWVEHDRATGSAVDQRLTELIRDEGPVAVTEPVIMEIDDTTRGSWASDNSHGRGGRLEVG